MRVRRSERFGVVVSALLRRGLTLASRGGELVVIPLERGLQNLSSEIRNFEPWHDPLNGWRRVQPSADVAEPGCYRMPLRTWPPHSVGKQHPRAEAETEQGVAESLPDGTVSQPATGARP